MHACVHKTRNIRFEHHRRRVPHEVNDMAGSWSADSAAQLGRVGQGADN